MTKVQTLCPQISWLPESINKMILNEPTKSTFARAVYNQTAEKKQPKICLQEKHISK